MNSRPNNTSGGKFTFLTTKAVIGTSLDITQRVTLTTPILFMGWFVIPVSLVNSSPGCQEYVVEGKLLIYSSLMRLTSEPLSRDTLTGLSLIKSQQSGFNSCDAFIILTIEVLDLLACRWNYQPLQAIGGYSTVGLQADVSSAAQYILYSQAC